MNLQQLTAWVNEISEVTNGGKVELRSGRDGWLEITVLWHNNKLGGMHYRKVLPGTEIRYMQDAAFAAFFDSITAAIRKVTGE